MECKELMSMTVSSINGEDDYDGDSMDHSHERDIDSPVFGRTALMSAVVEGYENVAKVLISAGADVNKINTVWGTKRTALMYAAQFGWPDICEILLSNGADITQRNHVAYGKTALDIAKENNHSEVVAVLERHGATVSELGLEQILEFHGISLSDIDKKDLEGNTPLINAASMGNKDACRLLIEAGADVNEVNNNDYHYEDTALMDAAEMGFKDICQMLIEAGADLEKQDINGQTALMKVGYGYDIAKMLISAGADVNKLDVSGDSALYLASTFGYTEIVKMLINAGADLDVTNTVSEKGWTPLMKATERGYTEICRLFVEAGAEIDEENAKGWTALFIAARCENTEASTLLIKAGASIEKASKYHYETETDWETEIHHYLAELGKKLNIQK